MISKELPIRRDVPKDERHKIRKADTPLIFITADGEVPCDKVIATDIQQLGITRDMYVMKDSPNVISIGRLVIDNGYGFIWKHRDRQAVLISLQGERHNLWNDMYTPMLAVQTSQDSTEPNNGLPSSAPIIPLSTAPVELPSQDTVVHRDSGVISKDHSGSASNTQFIEIFSGQCGPSTALQSLGHTVHSYDKKNDPNQDVLDKKCAQRIRQIIEKIHCIGVWFGMPCGTFTSARRYDGKGPKPLRSRERILGVPTLSGRDKLRVDLANELVDLMYDLCLLCRKTGTSFYIENPRSSLLWAMPKMKLLACLTGVQKVRFDYCQFGAPWNKPTTVMFFSSTLFKRND